MGRRGSRWPKRRGHPRPDCYGALNLPVPVGDERCSASFARSALRTTAVAPTGPPPGPIPAGPAQPGRSPASGSAAATSAKPRPPSRPDRPRRDGPAAAKQAGAHAPRRSGPQCHCTDALRVRLPSWQRAHQGLDGDGVHEEACALVLLRARHAAHRLPWCRVMARRYERFAGWPESDSHTPAVTGGSRVRCTLAAR